MKRHVAFCFEGTSLALAVPIPLFVPPSLPVLKGSVMLRVLTRGQDSVSGGWRNPELTAGMQDLDVLVFACSPALQSGQAGSALTCGQSLARATSTFRPLGGQPMPCGHEPALTCPHCPLREKLARHVEVGKCVLTSCLGSCAAVSEVGVWGLGTS